MSLCLFGCGDDGGGGGDGSTGTSTTSDDTTSSTLGETTSSSADGSTAMTMSMSGGSSSTGDGTVALGGDAIDFITMQPIVDAEVSIYMDDTIDPVFTDANGEWEFRGLPPSTELVVVVEPSEGEGGGGSSGSGSSSGGGIPGYLGAVIPEMTGDADVDNAQLSQVREMTVQMQVDILPAEAEAADLSEGVVIARLVSTTALQSGTVSVVMDPPPALNTYYGVDADTVNQVLNSEDITFALLPFVVYYNVPPSDVGTVSFTASHPTLTCAADHTMFPVLGGSVTLVDISCS